MEISSRDDSILGFFCEARQESCWDSHLQSQDRANAPLCKCLRDCVRMVGNSEVIEVRLADGVMAEKRRFRKLTHCSRLSCYPSAWAKSAMMSSRSSMPTDTRSSDSVTPISDFIGCGTSRCEEIQG